MKVVCNGAEWYPVAELLTDEGYLENEFWQKYIIEVTQEEYDAYDKIVNELHRMSEMFLARVNEALEKRKNNV